MIIMKRILKTMLLILIFMISSISCNKQELFVEEPVVVVDDDKPDDNGNTDDDDDDDTDATLPCDFTLDNVAPNSTIIIDCIMDLDGQTVNLPENVTLSYEGGDIINGTINFGDGGVIDGDLMNSTLTFTGSSPQVKDPIFVFDPDRWGIVQGQTTSEIAQENNNILESSMEKVKKLGVTTFKIDEMDAYFEVGKVTSKTTNQNFYATVEAINVPSDFNLEMTDKTHLRVFPNDAPKYCLLAVRDASNVTVKGGNLYGDRDAHDYSSGGTHEWGHVMQLHAAVNTTVSNVKMVNGSGDGIKISSLRFTFESNYAPSHNVLVKDCTFDSNRRNNISITDGYDIIIENNLLLNAGIDTPNSKGTNPKFGLDVEAVRASDGNGGYKHYERAEDILIRNNTERGSAAGAMTVHIGYKVTIEGNRTENSIGYTYTHGTKIKNNTITAGSSSGSTAISGGKNTTTGSIYDNEISGNVISGFDVGINVKNRDVLVYGNEIRQFLTGILPVNLKSSRIYNNTMTSNRDKSKGIFINVTSIDDVVFENNNITAKANAIKVTSCNVSSESSNYTLTFKENSLNSPSYTQIRSSKGITFDDNSFNQGIEVYDSETIHFDKNEITTSSHEGIYLRDTNKNIDITSNTIDVSSNRDCIKIDSSTSTSEVNNTNNNCI